MIRISVFSEVDGHVRLDHCHACYYHVQTQIFVCDVEYCDFHVCTFSGDEESIFTLKGSTEMIVLGRITVYPKRIHFLRSVYCLNYRAGGTLANPLIAALQYYSKSKK